MALLRVGSVTPRFIATTASQTIGSCTGSDVTQQTFTVTGLQPDMIVHVNMLTTTAHITLGDCRVSALNTLQVDFINLGSTATPSASAFYVVGF